jgi:hypothetical protein
MWPIILLVAKLLIDDQPVTTEVVRALIESDPNPTEGQPQTGG